MKLGDHNILHIYPLCEIIHLPLITNVESGIVDYFTSPLTDGKQ
jgi:hypothetical protein